MDADWYVDPLGRFDGRFFDGESWTERVSSDGHLVVDPDFDMEQSVQPRVAPTLEESSAEPAVEAVATTGPLRASPIEESPVRIVAVLEESVSGAPDRRRPIRITMVVTLLAVVAALAFVAFLLLRGDETSTQAAAEQVDLDAVQEERVEDLEAGGLSDAEPGAVEELEVDSPPDAVDQGTVFAADEMVEVGALRIANGASMLRELEDWHQGFAADRGIAVGADAGCWLGQLGGAAVQVAQCGPVGGSAETEFLFDLVPLLFEDIDGHQIALPVVDNVTTDAVLANALTLVGPADGTAPPRSLEGATRGDRGDG